jgi:heterodisulfide reductase subunit A
MCSGRVSAKFVERAFVRGAAAVLVAGCHLNDCHYINANYETKKRVERLWKKMERLGLDKNRLQLAWISAAEGAKFAKKMKEMQKIVDEVTAEEIAKTVASFTPKSKGDKKKVTKDVKKNGVTLETKKPQMVTKGK